MGLIQRFRDAGRALVGRSEEETGTLGPSGSAHPPARDALALLRTMKTSPWVRAIVGRLANSTGAVRWRIYARKLGNGRYVQDPMLIEAPFEVRQKRQEELREKGELIEVDMHPAARLLNGGSTLLIGLTLRELTSIYIDITGEAFWLLQRNKLGAPVSAWPLPPHWIANTPAPDRPFYEVRYGTLAATIPMREIVRFHVPDVEDPYGRGSGTLASLTDEINIDEYSSKHLTAWFYNRARPDVIVHGDGMTPKQTENLEKRWLETHRGFWKAYLPFFIGKKIEVQQLSQTFENMQLAELRRHERDVIQQVYGMPPEMFGNVENANRSTISAATFLFSRFQVLPRLMIQRDHLQKYLAPQYDYRISIDFDNPVDQDNDFMLQVMQANQSAFEIDEIRKLGNHKPLPDGMGKLHIVTNRVKTRRIKDQTDEPDKPPKQLPAPPPRRIAS